MEEGIRVQGSRAYAGGIRAQGLRGDPRVRVTHPSGEELQAGESRLDWGRRGRAGGLQGHEAAEWQQQQRVEQ